MRAADSISVVIPTWCREAPLRETLECFLTQSRMPDELIVVDQTPDGEHEAATLEALSEAARRLPGFRIVHASPPSLPRALNQGARLAQGDILAFCDDDIEAPPDLLASYLAEYQADGGPAAVGAQVRGGRNEQAQSIPPPHPLGFHRPVAPKNYVRRFEGPVLGGGSFSVRREAFLAVGGMDERLVFMSDEDLAWRLHAAGYRVVFEPRCWVRHREALIGGQASRRSHPLYREYHRSYSLAFFAFRHYRGRKRAGVLLQSLRAALSRDTVVTVWRIPWATAQWLWAVARASRLGRAAAGAAHE